MAQPLHIEFGSKRTKPILKWAGGKSGLLSQLSLLFPKFCNRFFEPFLGGGAVFFSLEHLNSPVINDANPELINLYRVIRDSPAQLMCAVDSLAAHYSEEFYYSLRRQAPSSLVEIAARTIFLNKTGFNGLYRQNAKGHFNVPFGKRVRCPALYDRENLLSAARRLKEAEILCEDFEATINRASSGDFVYCDPPYEPLSRSSSFNSYKGDGFSQEEQRRLFVACQKARDRGAYVLVSNSSAPFIEELYSAERFETVKANRAINSKGCSRGVIDEVVLVLLPEDFSERVLSSSQAKPSTVHLSGRFDRTFPIVRPHQASRNCSQPIDQNKR